MPSHIATPDVLGRAGTTSYPGHLIVEPWRHAPGLDDLTEPEARSVGWWCSVASSRALREVAGAEHVYAAVIGDAVPHLHIHLLPMFPGEVTHGVADSAAPPRRASGHCSPWSASTRAACSVHRVLLTRTP